MTKPAIGQDNGLNRRHAELVIRELAKFHAISYCMKADDNQSVLNKYAYLQVWHLFFNFQAKERIKKMILCWNSDYIANHVLNWKQKSDVFFFPLIPPPGGLSLPDVNRRLH